MNELIEKVKVWAADRDLLRPEGAVKQLLKTVEEVGETSGALLRSDNDKLKDGIGDSFVTLIILSYQCGFSPEECLTAAWEEIKDRKGETINGTFIKS
jgi:NTP pyrophosphatase (non-canonical NTP hydrolase)